MGFYENSGIAGVYTGFTHKDLHTGQTYSEGEAQRRGFVGGMTVVLTISAVAAPGLSAGKAAPRGIKGMKWTTLELPAGGRAPISVGKRALKMDQRLQVVYSDGGGRVSTYVPEGEFIWVQRTDGSFAFAKRGFDVSASVDRFLHPMLSGGRPVLAAGEGYGMNGRVVYLNSRSGHFQPPSTTLPHALTDLERSGMLGRTVRPDFSISGPRNLPISCSRK